jgi:hypothetical protein
MSAQKLMSVIVKKLDEQDSILFLLTRGMDNVIFERLKAGGDDWKWATKTSGGLCKFWVEDTDSGIQGKLDLLILPLG